MQYIETIKDLESQYGTPVEAAVAKVARRLTPAYRHWIGQSRFLILTTVGPEGTDASPRGDDGPVVREIDPGTLALPDWYGNNRIDSLRNIVRDPRVSLMFFVAGSTNVVRVNGRARLTADEELRQSFSRGGKLPRMVALIGIGEVYFQCARALVRSGFWSGRAAPADLPSAGDFLSEMTQGRIDGAAYDAEWPARAAGSLW